MFEAKVVNGGLVRRAIELTKEFVSEGNLDCTSDGISLQTMDNAHVALVEFNFTREGFETYRCDRIAQLGVNLAHMAKILKCMGTEDSIYLCAEEEGDALKMVFENQTQTRTGSYSLNLMKLTVDRVVVQEEGFQATIKMSSIELKRIFGDLFILGEIITISVNKEEVRFSVIGDIGSGSITLKKDGAAEKDSIPTMIEMKNTNSVSMVFSLKYLSSFTKGSPLSDMVVLGLCDGSPIQVCYNLGVTGYIRFYLAPSMEEAN